MKSNKIIIVSLLLLAVLTMGVVSASEDLTADGVTDESTGLSDVNDDLNSNTGDGDIVSSSHLNNDDDSSIRSDKNRIADDNEGNFSDIQTLIDNANENDTIELSGNYIGSETLNVDKALTIKGKGATLYAKGLPHVFNINANNVVLKNINFVNCYVSPFGEFFDKVGGVICWYGANGTLSNCSFVNCSSSPSVDFYDVGGGAVCWYGANGTLSNCSFVNCYTNVYGNYMFGSVVRWYGANGTLSNCSFVNCFSSITEGLAYGGAVCCYGVNSVLSGCSFVNCSANYGGAVCWYALKGSVVNCSFVNCSSSEGGAVYWNDDNDVLSGCSFVNCSSSEGGAVYWGGKNGILSNCSFVNCSNHDNYMYAHNVGGAVYWGGKNGILSNCSFVNCSNPVHEYDIYGGAVYWVGDNGVLSGCSFVNCSAEHGGAICWISDDGILFNCSFVDCYSYIDESFSYGGVISIHESVIFSVYKCTFNSSVYNCTFKGLSTGITASKVTATYAVSKKLTVTLKDKNGNKLKNKYVTVKVGTISKKLRTNSNGQVSVDVSGLVPKTYTATIKFAEDSYYEASSKKVTVVVKKANPKITAKSKTFKRTVKTKNLSITLKNNKNEVMKNTKVTIKVNGITYSATTNAKGVATFKITKLTKKGSFKSIITYAGSKYYNKVTKTVTIKTT